MSKNQAGSPDHSSERPELYLIWQREQLVSLQQGHRATLADSGVLATATQELPDNASPTSAVVYLESRRILGDSPVGRATTIGVRFDVEVDGYGIWKGTYYVPVVMVDGANAGLCAFGAFTGEDAKLLIAMKSDIDFVRSTVLPNLNDEGTAVLVPKELGFQSAGIIDADFV